MSSYLPAIHSWLDLGQIFEHEWLKSSNKSILEYHKNSMPQWIAESCHRYQVITYQESRLGGLGIEKQVKYTRGFSGGRGKFEESLEEEDTKKGPQNI
ncbi:hypothetical protein GLOIN_2v1886406 [Rhizophagus irregularis DAOM 181602=DAOM 197198]|nr:hypothetical protein GLOIN_2v1886406 [Rhizophagus irregularis DAOM 181602=DAOM 197198]